MEHQLNGPAVPDIWEFSLHQLPHSNDNLMQSKLNFTVPSMLSGRAGSRASLEVLFSLMRSKCIPDLLYSIKACFVDTRETISLEYPITCSFFKILKTLSSDLVNYCRLVFGLRQFSDVIGIQKRNLCHYNTLDICVGKLHLVPSQWWIQRGWADTHHRLEK